MLKLPSPIYYFIWSSCIDLNPQIMLVYLHPSSTLSTDMREIKCNLCIIFKYRRWQRQKGEIWESMVVFESLLSLFWYFTFTHLNLNLVPPAHVDTQEKAIITSLLNSPIKRCINTAIIILQLECIRYKCMLLDLKQNLFLFFYFLWQL